LIQNYLVEKLNIFLEVQRGSKTNEKVWKINFAVSPPRFWDNCEKVSQMFCVLCVFKQFVYKLKMHYKNFCIFHEQ